jgi:hypothetical protein
LAALAAEVSAAAGPGEAGRFFLGFIKRGSLEWRPEEKSIL